MNEAARQISLPAGEIEESVHRVKRVGYAVPLAIGVTIILWGSAYSGIRFGLSAYPPTHMALLRFMMATTLLLVTGLIRRIRWPAREDVWRFVLGGCLGVTVYHSLLNIGEETVTAGSASFVINTSPMFTALFAAIMLKDRIPGSRLAGLAIGFLGTVIIVKGEHHDFSWEPGVLLIVGAAIAQSLYIVILKPLLSRYTALECTVYAFVAGTLMLSLFSSGLVSSIRHAPPAATGAVMYLGAFPGAIGYLLWSYTLAHYPAARAAGLLYSIPVVTILIAWVWLGEVPAPMSVVGGAVALGGVALVNSNAQRKKNDGT